MWTLHQWHCKRKRTHIPAVTLEWARTNIVFSEGLTASMLASVCRDAAMRAIRESRDATSVKQRHFEAAIVGCRAEIIVPHLNR